MNQPCEHKRKGHTNGYLTIYCRDCRECLCFDWDKMEWIPTGETYPTFWQRLFGKRPR